MVVADTFITGRHHIAHNLMKGSYGKIWINQPLIIYFIMNKDSWNSFFSLTFPFLHHIGQSKICKSVEMLFWNCDFHLYTQSNLNRKIWRFHIYWYIMKHISLISVFRELYHYMIYSVTSFDHPGRNESLRVQQKGANLNAFMWM